MLRKGFHYTLNAPCVLTIADKDTTSSKLAVPLIIEQYIEKKLQNADTGSNECDGS